MLHEFSSIKGVREDVTDIVLNVKSLAIKSSVNAPKKIILDVKGTKEVLNVIIKTDVGGTCEAILAALNELGTEKAKVKIVR